MESELNTNPKDKLTGSNLSDQPAFHGGTWTSMNRTLIFMVILFWFFGWPYLVHAGDIRPGVSIFVYKLDGTNHCETGTGVDLVAMERELLDAGITVISMRKGFDGREGIAVCGSPTGQINIYEISAPGLETAQRVGFKRLPHRSTSK